MAASREAVCKLLERPRLNGCTVYVVHEIIQNHITFISFLATREEY